MQGIYSVYQCQETLLKNVQFKSSYLLVCLGICGLPHLRALYPTDFTVMVSASIPENNLCQAHLETL